MILTLFLNSSFIVFLYRYLSGVRMTKFDTHILLDYFLHCKMKVLDQLSVVFSISYASFYIFIWKIAKGLVFHFNKNSKEFNIYWYSITNYVCYVFVMWLGWVGGDIDGWSGWMGDQEQANNELCGQDPRSCQLQ